MKKMRSNERKEGEEKKISWGGWVGGWVWMNERNWNEVRKMK